MVTSTVVKNPGLLPGKDSLKHGDVGKRKEEIEKYLIGCWRSCIEAGDGMEDAEYSEKDAARWKPFVANAIIANPPSFAFAHCAEKLGIPFHLMFTYVLKGGPDSRPDILTGQTQRSRLSSDTFGQNTVL